MTVATSLIAREGFEKGEPRMTFTPLAPSRSTDPVSSKSAAERMNRGAVKGHVKWILDVMRWGQTWTAGEISNELSYRYRVPMRLDFVQVCHRLKGMSDVGLIERAGEPRTCRVTGKTLQSWRIAPPMEMLFNLNRRD